MSYLGPFNKEFRELLLTRDFYDTCIKLGIPVTKDLQVGAALEGGKGRGRETIELPFTAQVNALAQLQTQKRQAAGGAKEPEIQTSSHLHACWPAAHL